MLNPSLKDLNLSLEELKEVVKLLPQKRGIKGCKGMSNNKLLDALILSKPVEKGKKPSFSKARIEKIRKEFNESRHKFL